MYVRVRIYVFVIVCMCECACVYASECVSACVSVIEEVTASCENSGISGQ